jgi:phosphoribosylformylglycinamidine cyclo-ligase
MSSDSKNDSSVKEASRTYAESGVNTVAADKFVEQIQKLTNDSTVETKLKGGIGAYAAVYEWTPDSWMAVGCDGVGTKILWTLEGLGSAEDLAQDLVAMSVNDLLCVGARPQMFLDYVGFTDGALLKEGALLPQFLQGLQWACVRSGALLVGGETAQMPGFYKDNHFDVSGFCVGQMRPTDWLHAERLRPGAEVWAWKSDGPHANGFSWLRDIFDPGEDAEFIKNELMPPTKLYVNEIAQLRSILVESQNSEALQAAYHITGSGLKNLLRLQPEGREIGFELDERTDYPKWFLEAQERTGATLKELLCSFNAGWGMVVVLDAEASSKISGKLENIGLKRVGKSIDSAKVVLGSIEIRGED